MAATLCGKDWGARLLGPRHCHASRSISEDVRYRPEVSAPGY
jgi:hypothetical protein